jgi:hypothetical protein
VAPPACEHSDRREAGVDPHGIRGVRCSRDQGPDCDRAGSAGGSHDISAVSARHVHFFQCLRQLTSRVDSELPVHLSQVVIDRVGA